MSTALGSGLYINPAEKDQKKFADSIRQLMEGRSNAVGTFTLTGDSVATTTVVTAQTCGPSSVVIAFPATANAAAVVGTTYIQAADIAAGTFTVTHAATGNSDCTFFFVCLG